MSDPHPRGSAGQTFLVGESLYLRGLELADAKRASAWRASPFPIPAERAEEILKKELPAEAKQRTVTLVACRVADDEPVGATTLGFADVREASVRLHADPVLGEDGAAVKAEVLRLVVPWLTLERHFMVVLADLDADETAVVAAAEAVGMRPAVRLREALWRDGGRHDQLTYELLHPGWLARLGDPGPGIVHATEPVAIPRAPAPPRASVLGPAPLNAIMVGRRLALRPLEAGDAEPMARWSRQETETFFDDGRRPWSPILLADRIVQSAASDPPREIEFAIVLRDGGELIGDNGLYNLDWLNRTAETGTYIYRPEHRSGGYGTEAKHLLLEYAFERVGLHMVWSTVWGPNTRSAAALRKQGYRDAGRVHWSSQQGGEFADYLCFDLLATEWRAAREMAAGVQA